MAAWRVRRALKFFFTTGRRSLPFPSLAADRPATKGCERASWAVMRWVGSMVKQRLMNSRACSDTPRQYSMGVNE